MTTTSWMASSSELYMAKATNKKQTKKKSTGLKGFGSVTTKSSSQQQQVELD
jgi:hypothetical protein